MCLLLAVHASKSAFRHHLGNWAGKLPSKTVGLFPTTESGNFLTSYLFSSWHRNNNVGIAFADLTVILYFSIAVSELLLNSNLICECGIHYKVIGFLILLLTLFSLPSKSEETKIYPSQQILASESSLWLICPPSASYWSIFQV